MTSPSSMPARPTPHWSMSAIACRSASSVVTPYGTSCVYTTTSAPVRSSISSIVVSTCAMVAGRRTPASS